MSPIFLEFYALISNGVGVIFFPFFLFNTFSCIFLFLRKSGVQQNSLLGYCCLCLYDERKPVLSIYRDVGVHYYRYVRGGVMLASLFYISERFC